MKNCRKTQMLARRIKQSEFINMNMSKFLGVVACALILAACGGGSSNQSMGPGPSGSLQISTASGQVLANPEGFAPNPDSPHTTEIQVRFRQASGSNVADGTTVNLSTSNSSVGLVSPINDPAASGSSAASTTAAGVARFWFNAGSQAGTVTLTASAANPAGGGNLSASLSITVAPNDGAGQRRIEITANDLELPANVLNLQPAANSLFSTQVNVRVLSASGNPAEDGTAVTLGVDNSARAVVSPLDDPQASGATASGEVVAGFARFLLTSQESAGPVVLTAGLAADQDGDAVQGEPLTVNIVPNQQDSGRLNISGASTMPANTQGVPIFIGSPFINELTVEYTGPDGGIGQVEGGEIAVAVSPIFRGAFSTLNDPSTDENEFEILVGAGPVIMTAGVTTLFIHSFDRPGPLQVSVLAQDAETGERFSEKFIVDIIDGAADFLPASLDFSASPAPIYVTGSGGATNKQIQLTVRDSGGNVVPDPEADGVSWNNVLLELDAPAGSNARLAGTGKDGPVSSESAIRVRTVNGIAAFSLNAGSEPGPHRITATVDRADNNVDNTLTDPLSANSLIRVGDGRLFSLRLVSPPINAISVNPRTDSIGADFPPVLDPGSGDFVPPAPDGTYSLTVTVIATDKQGNPPLSGTNIRFGKIDSPLTPTIPGFFVFSGAEGDPEEGGVLFTAMDVAEGFLDDPTRPDEAVEPGDTLALFGKAVPGNREHEAARIVASVIDDNTLTVTEPFNPNDATGSPVDDGAVIPWVIGRSEVGFIDSSLTLDSRGRGSVRLTYPINAIGAPVVLWAQGDRVEPTTVKTVADVEGTRFPAILPLRLTVVPNVVRGNTSTTMTICVEDALRAPVNNTFVRGFVSDGPASGSLDGDPMPTFTERATGTAGPGCVNTVLTTTGMIPDGDDATVTFNVGEAFADVQVVEPNSALLEVDPPIVFDNSIALVSRLVNLRLLSPAGEPIVGVPLSGECDGGDGTLEITINPGITNSMGRTTATVLVGMAGCGDSENDDSFPRIGQCEFTTESGEPVGLFTAVGNDLRQISLPSPGTDQCPPLEDEPPVSRLIVSVVDERATPGNSTITSTPEGIGCNADDTASPGCVADFDESQVVLQAPQGTTPVWGGDCSGNTEALRFATVTFPTASSPGVCTVTFQD